MSSRPLLSAALIVKNEEKHLPDCLAALDRMRPLLGEICIYDTGSTDGTVELAEAAGARVERGYWDDDFARARNAAIEMCSGKWVLIVDADEHAVADLPRLRRWLTDRARDRPAWDALSVRVDDVRNGRTVESWMSARLLRSQRSHYEGEVHEQVVSIRGDLARSTETPFDALVLQHIGYADEQVVAAKRERNAALADASVQRLDGRGGSQEELVRALVDRARSLTDDGATMRAIDDLERVRQTFCRTVYRLFGLELLAALYIEQKDWKAAKSVIEELRVERTDGSWADWLTAQLLLGEGHPEEAMSILRRLDKIQSAAGYVPKPAVLLKARFEGAVALGAFDEAIATLIPLMVGQGARGYGPILLRLWQDRPLGLLIDLLVEYDKGHLAGLADELQTCDAPGAEIAELLRSPQSTLQSSGASA